MDRPDVPISPDLTKRSNKQEQLKDSLTRIFMVNYSFRIVEYRRGVLRKLSVPVSWHYFAYLLEDGIWTHEYSAALAR
ncbi:hypothetical protein E2C01_005305 [Portunus trituberculatus]|uniref:Uncharacterized protein n=1 Tax=Portunus trituberculatus TaxID=210409 RepID=A0A5B7CS89_PORTR|nr:hypothetical protein [Portunus trituberculatus]